MHAHATHRVRIIAAPSKQTSPTQEAPPAQLSRQAALFRRLHEGSAGADVQNPDAESFAAPPKDADANPLYGIVERYRNERRDDTSDGESGNSRDRGESGDGNARDDGDADNPCARYDITLLAALHAPIPVPMLIPVPISLPAQPPLRPGATDDIQEPERRVVRTVTAIEAPRHADNDIHRLLESIVSEVADFFGSPVVIEGGNCQITIPLDQTVLPGCTLRLTHSRFKLTLRFETEEQQSRQLISQHAQTLRTSLEQVLQARSDETRSVEIIVI